MVDLINLDDIKDFMARSGPDITFTSAIQEMKFLEKNAQAIRKEIVEKAKLETKQACIKAIEALFSPPDGYIADFMKDQIIEAIRKV